ncbi:MAG: type VI secretion system contractile sheath large subunit [Desulfobacteraceae bacterium]|nr:type VI secretion system contractile sheath large subunit [Desulfobacteraceae bacterium]
MAESPLPYKILALGPFAPLPEGTFIPGFVQVDLYSLDDAVSTVSPVLYLPLAPEGAVTLKLKRIKDFKPGEILKSLTLPVSPSKKAPLPGAPQPKKADPSAQGHKAALEDILSMVAVPGAPFDRVRNHTNEDPGPSLMLREIFSNPTFRKTESAWRGLQTLIQQAEIKGFERIRLSLSCVSPEQLETVLDAVEALPPEDIPNLVLIDLGFDNTLPSLKNLEKVLGFADRMLAPCCAWISPEFFRIENWNRLHKIPYIRHYLDDMAYARFRKLKTHAGAAWVMLLANAFAVRPAHECEDGPLFVSPVWGMGALCAKSVAASGWPLEFTRYPGYQMENLAMAVYDEKNTASTQTLFSEDRILQLIEAGITPMAGAKHKDTAFIPKAASLAGDSIKFQLLMNRMVEALLHARRTKTLDNPGDEIRLALTRIFTQTGHGLPQTIDVANTGKASHDGQVFHISVLPPESVFPGSGPIEFSFVW